MRRLVFAALVAAAGCGSAPAVGSAEMQLSATDLPAKVAAVELLVFDGSDAGCARALAGASPLDDSGLAVVAHALFTIDGTPKHLPLPAGEQLVFYAEAYDSTAPSRALLGRGCAEATLAANAASPVAITITTTPTIQ